MNKIITIGREYGAGGREIGAKVAQQLGIPIYDKDIIRETVKESGYETALVEEEGEDISKRDAFLKEICEISSIYFRDTQNAIFEVQRAVILQFAKKGPCVIVGRCADVILKQAGIDCLNVFIHADAVHRAIAIGSRIGSTNATEIQQLMKKKDESRQNYYSHYTRKNWNDSRNYHLTLDSGILGYDTCAKIIIESANQ